MWEKRYFSEPPNVTTIKHLMRHAAKEKIIRALLFFFGKDCIEKKRKKKSLHSLKQAFLDRFKKTQGRDNSILKKITQAKKLKISENLEK